MKKSLWIKTLLFLSLVGCEGVVQTPSEGNRVNSDNISVGAPGQALVYEANPIVLSGNTNFPLATIDWNGLLTSANITEDPTLRSQCEFTQIPFSLPLDTQNGCVVILNDKTSLQPIQSNNGSWTYTNNSDEFYQVNVYYHINKMIKRFHTALSLSHSYTHTGSTLTLPPATKYNLLQSQAFWFNSNGSSQELKVIANCVLDSPNSYFDSSLKEICMGYTQDTPYLRFNQDPSVIYHELGHALVKIMMNQRNTTNKNGLSVFNPPNWETLPYTSDLGNSGYDEAGAINEGIADYFSYYMSGRTDIGEWAMGRKFQAARPMTEISSLHIGNVSKTDGQRLSYPTYVAYDPNFPEDELEDIHYAGQIVSHYLVELTESFKSSCGITHNIAADYTMVLLNETLSEIGDLTANGSDYFNEYASANATNALFTSFTNLNSSHAYLWTQQVNPPNFRRFFRIFGKNILHYISDPTNGLCSAFSADESENLLDNYGFLLFSSYEDDGNGSVLNTSTYEASPVTYSDKDNHNLISPLSPSGFNNFKTMPTKVNELNRRHTVLVSKEFIDITNDPEDSIGFVFDNQASIRSILSSLTFEGNPIYLSEGLSGYEYNNSNGRISPGEVIGIAPNLKNYSNSIMGGVQVLANDWDHMKLETSSNTYVYSNVNNSSSLPTATWRPCQIDGWPLETEGALTSETLPGRGNCNTTSTTNRSLYNTSSNPRYDLDSPQPICLVQYNDDDETTWVAQDSYRRNVLNLTDTKCLNNPNGESELFNPNECLLRALPGANQANYGKIEPQETWVQTATSNGTQPTNFTSANVLLFEVNKWVQPGTKFNCRMRVRFSNCQNCYEDSSGDEYSDFEYAGHKPYKVINFTFEVQD